MATMSGLYGPSEILSRASLIGLDHEVGQALGDIVAALSPKL